MASEVRVEDGYVLVNLAGEVRPGVFRGLFAGSDELALAVNEFRRVLIDVSEVDDVLFDPVMLGEAAARNNATRGVRFAIAATTPAMFGLGRQVAQISGLEGVAVSVFHSREEAAAWLLALEK
ncbi:MAG: hypothetical protein AB7N24_01190 [Dehalococcoidia bacterium]